jgi:hypothetical protein
MLDLSSSKNRGGRPGEEEWLRVDGLLFGPYGGGVVFL